MAKYLLSIYQPDGEPPEPAVLDPIMHDLDRLQKEMKSAGVWVFAAGLHAPSTATVVRRSGDETVTTDGPYLEGKEHVGGFTIIDVPDLDAALAWADKYAQAVALLPTEVRPMQDGTCEAD